MQETRAARLLCMELDAMLIGWRQAHGECGFGFHVLLYMTSRWCCTSGLGELDFGMDVKRFER